MLSLAARLRPQHFDDVVGQDTVRKVLKNGLSQNKLSQICLFWGPAGTGKTTLARVVALWLVCSNKTDGKACMKCENCQAAINGSHPDITEFDAATYTGVDDIKDALESTAYQPQLSAYKIYIIDEIHMLSRSAISALLKMIEEPPAHVWFLFATTEKEKIPDTIVSRCLTLALHNIPTQKMLHYLKEVCVKEGFGYEEEAIKVIVDTANGYVRLALSLLEQTSLIDSNGAVTLEGAREVCGVADQENITNLHQAIMSNNIKSIFELSEILIERFNPIDICFQLLNKAKDTSDIFLGQQVVQIMEEIYRSPAPGKVLGMLLAKAAFMHTLPKPEQLWQALKSCDSNNINMNQTNPYMSNKPQEILSTSTELVIKKPENQKTNDLASKQELDSLYNQAAALFKT